jgi:hypothetical protein
MNRNDGESCPGEDECGDPTSRDAGPLAKYGSDDTEAICRGCRLRESKPEAIPAELAQHVATAVEMDEIQAVGGSFTYPDGLTAAEWAALRGLSRGRAAAEKLRPKPK